MDFILETAPRGIKAFDQPLEFIERLFRPAIDAEQECPDGVFAVGPNDSCLRYPIHHEQWQRVVIRPALPLQSRPLAEVEDRLQHITPDVMQLGNVQNYAAGICVRNRGLSQRPHEGCVGVARRAIPVLHTVTYNEDVFLNRDLKRPRLKPIEQGLLGVNAQFLASYPPKENEEGPMPLLFLTRLVLSGL